jgi:PTH1 family peptidyl-tRNA hydrolase
VKLVVGLGNPGRKYTGTRHNVGYELANELARRYGSGRPRQRFQGEVVEARIDGVPALLLCPHTYMNRSGRSVAEALKFYKLDPSELLVACDDINLPVAKVRLRASGSSGGQNGLNDVIRSLGTQEFSRLRIGVGTPPPGWDAADYVLGRLDKHDASEIEDAIQRAADAVAHWAIHGIDDCMNQFN